MNQEQSNQALYDKMRAEQENYRSWLLSLPPQEILNHAYEYSIREDILATMSEGQLPSALAKALLYSERPLAVVYADWRSGDCHYREELFDVIQDRAEIELQQLHNGMEICIYQIDRNRDQKQVAFLPLEELPRFQGSSHVVSCIYNSVYRDVVECASLEDVFSMFNLNHPEGYIGHSLSVSDVVQVIHASSVEPGFYFCDSVGFAKIDFDPAQTKDMTKAIRILLLEPGKPAKPTLINNTLGAMQELVGGHIEVVSLPDGCFLICNDEGKFRDLPPNRALKDRAGNVTDVIVGTCFICGTTGSEFTGLTPEQMKYYRQSFQYPQQFSRRNGELIARDIKPHDMER